MTKNDRDALKLAIEIARKESPARAEQIDCRTRPGIWWEPWAELAQSCAISCQNRALDLLPWEFSPATIENIDSALNAPDEDNGIRDAALLLQRMQRCGVSKWHPDPIAACEAAEAKAAP